MKELFENTWTHEADDVRIFLLAGAEKALVIDTGMPGLDIRALAAEHTDLPLELLITHSDEDHISANDQFEWMYMHPSEIPVYRNAKHGAGKICPVFDGDTIDLGERVLGFLLPPGHTPGRINCLSRNIQFVNRG